jgi:uncharacterized membrane protein
MSHLKEVRNIHPGRSHWVAYGPAGIPVEWDALITRHEPNSLISWASEPGAAVQSSGTVRFGRNPAGGTRVEVQMSYNPVAGAIGHAVASLFGVDPKHAMDDDLARLKTLLEQRGPGTDQITSGGEWRDPAARLKVPDEQFPATS